MSKSVLSNAFAHHVWATLRVIDTRQALSPEQLDTSVPGTYGSILERMRHLVGAGRCKGPSITFDTAPPAAAEI